MIRNDESPLPDTDVHFLRSDHVADEFKILVARCGAAESDPTPVLFLGDPWTQFGTAVEIVRLLSYCDNIPPLLVVGVGYRPAGIENEVVMRQRDFTPTIDLAHGYQDPTMMGGASRFVSFFRDELKPWLRERYSVDPDDSAYYGYSLGGLFATYVLLNQPDTFPRYGIGSPALFWDNGLMFDHEQTYARTHDDLQAKVYLSVGEYETPSGERRWLGQLSDAARAKWEPDQDAFSSANRVSDVERMVASLRTRHYPGLDLEYEKLAREYHDTAPPLALSHAVRFLFDAPR